jgi:hypothetical protein
MTKTNVSRRIACVTQPSLNDPDPLRTIPMNARTTLFITLLFSLCTLTATAAMYTRSDIDGDWTNTVQWTPNGCPNSPADDALFSGFTGTRTITIRSAATTAYLRIDSPTRIAGLTAAGAGTRRLVMTNNAGNAQIVLQQAARFAADSDYPQIEVRQPTDIIVSQSYARFANDFVGTADLHLSPRWLHSI